MRAAGVGQDDLVVLDLDQALGDAPDRKKADEVIAERAVSPQEAMMAAEIVAKELGALREAIATANARELDIDLDASLLE